MAEAHKTLPELLDSSFVVVDKPRGPSSHEVSSLVKNILGIGKSGHSGTLDPNVSGVLPVALGRATKLLAYLTTKDKKYVCLMKTGRKLTERDINDLFSRFTGEITQTPPKQSAVAKRPRKRHVYYLLPLQVRAAEVLFEVHCEAGTYVRVLVSEMGKHCNGAKMLELRRIQVGSISESSSHTLQEISDAIWKARELGDEAAIRGMLIGSDEALQLPKIILRDSAIEAVCAGSALFAPGVHSLGAAFEKGRSVALYSRKGELIGVGRAEASSKEASAAKGGPVALPERIMMKRGTYPKGW